MGDSERKRRRRPGRPLAFRLYFVWWVRWVMWEAFWSRQRPLFWCKYSFSGPKSTIFGFAWRNNDKQPEIRDELRTRSRQRCKNLSDLQFVRLPGVYTYRHYGGNTHLWSRFDFFGFETTTNNRSARIISIFETWLPLISILGFVCKTFTSPLKMCGVLAR